MVYVRHRLNRIARPTNFIRSGSPDQSSETQRSLPSVFTVGWRLKSCTRGGNKPDRGGRSRVPPTKHLQRLLERPLTKSGILKLKASNELSISARRVFAYMLFHDAIRSPSDSGVNDKWLVPRKKSAQRKRPTVAIVVIRTVRYCRIGIWPITRSR